MNSLSMYFVSAGAISLFFFIVFYVLSSSENVVDGAIEQAFSMLFLATSLALLLGRGLIPDFLSIVIANGFAFYSLLLSSTSIRKLCKQKTLISTTVQCVLLVLYMSAFAWFHYIYPSFSIRVGLFSIVSLILLGDQFKTLWKYEKTSFARSLVLAALFAFLSIRLTRLVINILSGESSINFISPSPIQTIVLGMPTFLLPIFGVGMVILILDRKQLQLTIGDTFRKDTGIYLAKAGLNQLKLTLKKALVLGTPLNIALFRLSGASDYSSKYGYKRLYELKSLFALKLDKAVDPNEHCFVIELNEENYVVVYSGKNEDEFHEKTKKVCHQLTKEFVEPISVSLTSTILGGDSDDVDSILDRLYRNFDSSLNEKLVLVGAR